MADNVLCHSTKRASGPPQYSRTPRSHKRTIFGLLQPRLILGKGRIIASTGAVPKLDLALGPPAFAPQALTLSAARIVVVA